MRIRGQKIEEREIKIRNRIAPSEQTVHQQFFEQVSPKNWREKERSNKKREK
jgi:hypothetical protein